VTTLDIVLRIAVLVIAVLAVAAPAAAAAPYSTLSGPERANARFVVGYEGSGSYRTTFHGEPPNDGGPDDANDAHDTSAQAWKLGFRHGITFPTCAQPDFGGPDPCAQITGLEGARGATSMDGVVNHKHVDGPYRQLDRTVKCRLHKATSARTKVQAVVGVRYLPDSQSFGVTAYNPLTTAIENFAAQCQNQGDSIDRILDFYAMPGFSFADGYGPARWFTSPEVVIPAAVLHRSKRIRIPLAETPAGRSPKRCEVQNPSYERCRTGGRWSGVLTLTARG
jgi:hypothetical protein